MNRVQELIDYNATVNIRDIANYAGTIRRMYNAVVEIASTLETHQHLTKGELTILRQLTRALVRNEALPVPEENIQETVNKIFSSITDTMEREAFFEKEQVKAAIEAILRGNA